MMYSTKEDWFLLLGAMICGKKVDVSLHSVSMVEEKKREKARRAKGLCGLVVR